MAVITNDSARETADRWSRLVKQTWTDESLKRRLLDNPVAVLEEHGLKPRPGVEVRVVENTDKVAYLTLPPRGAESELSPDELDRVAGGTFAFGGVEVTYTPQKRD